jgi:DNA-binding transcriptional MocR family regulator
MDINDFVERLGDWRSSGALLSRSLADRIAESIQAGVLLPEDTLPAERTLAEALAVSRTTVKMAYVMLSDEGWTQSLRGSGTRVLKRPVGHVGASKRRIRMSNPLSQLDAAGADRPDLIDLSLSVARPDPSWTVLSAAGQALLNQHHGYQPKGLLALRQRIAHRLHSTGIPATAENVLITNGVQHGIAMVAQHFGCAGRRVLLEDPTYFGALDAFRDSGTSLIPVDWDRPGRERRFIDAMRSERPELAYVCPSFQNPTGHVWSESLLREMVSCAQETGTLLIVDNALADLAFDIPAPRPANLAGGASMVVLGGLSTTLWGGLRVGWLCGHASLVDALTGDRLVHEFGANNLSGAMACDLLDRFDELIQLRVKALRSQHDCLVSLLTQRLPSWKFSVPGGGNFLWIELPNLSLARQADLFAECARAWGVGVTPGALLRAGRKDALHIRITYNASIETLTEATLRLEEAWKSFMMDHRALG